MATLYHQSIPVCLSGRISSLLLLLFLISAFKLSATNDALQDVCLNCCEEVSQILLMLNISAQVLLMAITFLIDFNVVQVVGVSRESF